MGIKAAMWVHGTIAQPELTGPFFEQHRRGWGTHFKANNMDNWFHFPVANPVILDDVRPQLARVFVLYSTAGDAALTHVHVYDGRQVVATFDGLVLQGDHSTGLDPANTWTLNPALTIRFGLGISVGVHFGAVTTRAPEIVFYTVGGDLVAP